MALDFGEDTKDVQDKEMIDFGPKESISPSKDIVEEKWMFILYRYPDGKVFPGKLFKLGMARKKNVAKKKRKQIKLPEVKESKEERI